MELLRREGIEVVPSSSLTDSSLVINGTDGNSGANITCVAFEQGIISEFRSRTSQVIFHGPPDIPFNLLVMENGPGSLNVSWSHATIEGVAVYFTLTATNLNDSNADPILVILIEDLCWTLTIPDSTSCDVYRFQVTAVNAAGSSSPSDTVTSSFPALPDISAVEDSLEYSLTTTDSGIMLNVNLTDVSSCPEYPVHNYTLVVVDSEGSRTTQTSQATGDIVNIAISGLRENTRYSYYVIATNEFGDSNPSARQERQEIGGVASSTTGEIVGIVLAVAVVVVVMAVLFVLIIGVIHYRKNCLKSTGGKPKNPALFSKRGASRSYTVNEDLQSEKKSPSEPKVEVRDISQYDVIQSLPVHREVPVDSAGYAYLESVHVFT